MNFVLKSKIKDESVEVLLETAAKLRREADEMERQLKAEESTTEVLEIAEIKEKAQRTKKKKMHPAVSSQRAVDARLDKFEAQLNNTELPVRLGAAACYIIPAIEVSRLATNQGFTADIGFFALFILLNVGIEWTTPRLLRFSAFQAILFNVLSDFVVVPTIHLSVFLDATAAWIPIAACELLFFACSLYAIGGQNASFVPITGNFIQQLSKWSESEIINILTNTARKGSIEESYDDDDDDDDDK
eukprot:CAMPEP_0197310230 /NCGR_PEP_ID=MMETSP0891-20130614/8846_1 /TAXON_ID=44058 ORGANISM="Aureoumbra lagunensis, Strain CCMP1510" /NCGR_SAMPLE_ID=MMETSP0891 /ASSEMBLY_ACC=CAM_ASM_000534 /LENGTH=244 /DNA_ID=CAMNT_0042795775 /DNA_START=74 /DNA_END=808 /DNA_ORIENTATION=-